MTGLLTRKLKKKLSLSLSWLFLSTALTLSAAPAAEAFDWSNAIGSIVLVSAQYSMLNKQVAYLDAKAGENTWTRSRARKGSMKIRKPMPCWTR